MHLCKITILGFLAFVSPVFKVTDENIFVGKWDHGIFFVNSIKKHSENENTFDLGQTMPSIINKILYKKNHAMSKWSNILF